MVTTTAKVVNYSPAQTVKMVADYIAGGTGKEAEDFDGRDAIVEQIATELKKGVRSVRSKLTREKRPDGTQVYIARSSVSKVTGEKPAKKDAMAENLIAAAGDTSGVSETSMLADSVEKMNKTEISIITAQFKALHSEIEALNAEIDDLLNPDENAGEATD